MFKWFRRNQKILLVVAGVLIMIVFVLGDALQGWMQRDARGDDPVVVSTSYGDITETQLARMRQSRELANRFFAQLRGVPEFYGPPGEEALVRRFVLANKAAQMGFVVTDEQISDHILVLAGDQRPGSEIAELVKRMGATESQLFTALRTELLSRQLQMTFVPQLTSATPGERWEYYQRLHSTATIEAIATPAANFIEKVADPSPEELVAFFDGAKDVEPSPGSPDPGFKIPHKVDLQYIVAEYEKFVDPQSVTDADVQKYYDEHKEQFRWSGLDIPEKPEEPKADATKESDTAADDMPPESSPGTPESTDETPKPPQDSPESSATDAAPSDEPGSGQSTEGAAAPEPPSETSEPAPSGDGGCDAGFQDDAGTEQPADEAPPPSTDEPTLKPADSTEAAAADKDASTTDANTADAKPVTETAEGSPDASGLPPKAPFTPSAPLESDDYPLPRDIAGGPNPDYDPLWKVADMIRRQIARQNAVAAIRKSLEPLQNQVRSYEVARTQWLAHRDANPDSALREPPMPDFKAIAEQKGLRLESTGLVTAYELADMPGIGEAAIIETFEPIVQFAFGRSTTYLPKIADDVAQNHYLVWKTEDAPARVPELDEIRGEVVRAWKMIKARELAENQAKQLADEARNKKLSLKELAEERGLTSIETSPFSWLTEDRLGALTGQSRPPQLSEVKDVEDAGNDFMRVVFGMDVGDVGVAFNNPQTTAYVVRVTSVAPSRPVLRSLFIAAPYEHYLAAGGIEEYEYAQAWIDGIEEEARVEWKRKADADRRS